MFYWQKQVENADRVEEKMSFDGLALGQKLGKYRAQFMVSINELSKATGISSESLKAFENGEKLPTGDEILILSDFFQCDYKFFISNEKLAPFEQTETLFRRHGNEFSKKDRWAIQEFLYLSECESFLISKLGFPQTENFVFKKTSNNHKINGIAAAKELRNHFGYDHRKVVMDVYKDFRSIGIHTFRRQLHNSDISGLYVRHPTAGKCILINYSEDIYRQRFTAAHEAAHAILEDERDGVLVSFKGASGEYVEIGANNFASQYLMPSESLKSISDSTNWTPKKALEWANKLKVSTEAFAYALKSVGLIDNSTVDSIKRVRVRKELKIDPELPQSLSPMSYRRKEELLKQGLSSFYVNLCFDAYRKKIISVSRMAEMLLIDLNSLYELAELYNENL